MTPRLLLAVLGALGVALALWMFSDPPRDPRAEGESSVRPAAGGTSSQSAPAAPGDAVAGDAASEPPGAPRPPLQPPEDAPAPPRAASPWAGPLAWHDGDGAHVVHASRRLLVAFRQVPGPDGRPSPPVPGARAVGQRPGVTIWELPEGAEAPEALARARERGGAWSPAFQEQEGAGRVLAMPGGVFLRLDPGWESERVQAWAERAGVPAPRALEIGPGWHMVSTPPGEAALETAERLRALPEVVEAFPDWWRDYASR